MKHALMTATTLAVCTTGALAGGIDRSGQPIGIIFEKGNYVELSYGVINPSVTGTDAFGQPTGSVAGNHSLPGIALKYDLTDKLSLSAIYDHAYGADIAYGATTPMLAGTFARVSNDGLTGILRYKFDDNFSAHGGVRVSRASGDVGLNGLAYGGLSGYEAKLDSDWAAGYIIGGAYERPDIALRLAVTYFSKVSHSFDTVETVPGLGQIPTTTDVDTPEAFNVDFQTGVAENTLVFGSMRWVHWSKFKIAPNAFFGPRFGSLANLNSTTTWTLGVGRKFNDHWSGSAFVTYEDGGDPLVSPLAPTNGYKGIGLAAVYTDGPMKVTAGIRYLDLGDAQPQTGGTARADMTGNHAVAVGLRVGYAF